jgi:hypothetical protein
MLKLGFLIKETYTLIDNLFLYFSLSVQKIYLKSVFILNSETN